MLLSFGILSLPFFDGVVVPFLLVPYSLLPLFGPQKCGFSQYALENGTLGTHDCVLSADVVSLLKNNLPSS